MRTQISIQVKNENWISRCMSIYMSLGLFVKAKVNMYIDDAECKIYLFSRYWEVI